MLSHSKFCITGAFKLATSVSSFLEKKLRRYHYWKIFINFSCCYVFLSGLDSFTFIFYAVFPVIPFHKNRLFTSFVKKKQHKYMYHMWQFLLANSDLKSLETTQQFSLTTHMKYMFSFFSVFLCTSENVGTFRNPT